MSSVQWFYRPSEQRKKGSKMLRVIMGTVFHLSGLVYYIVYLNNDNPDTNKQVFGISLAMAYIGGILAFWLILNKTLMVKEKRYSLMGDDIEIKDAKLKNGLLEIELEQIVPEHKKPRTIKVK